MAVEETALESFVNNLTSSVTSLVEGVGDLFVAAGQINFFEGLLVIGAVAAAYAGYEHYNDRYDPDEDESADEDAE